MQQRKADYSHHKNKVKAALLGQGGGGTVGAGGDAHAVIWITEYIAGG